MFIDTAATLNETITSLRLEISTVKAGDSYSTDFLYVNIVLQDGTRLYEPENFFTGFQYQGGQTTGKLPLSGQSASFNLPVESGIVRRLGEVAEIYLRKDGSDGWFVGSVLLFANGHALPLIGNRHANQFLDNDWDNLDLRDWSTKSFNVAPSTNAKHPLPRSGYRILGPVLGQLSDSSAVVLYRVDREGPYRFVAVDSVTGATVLDSTQSLEPTGRFVLTDLQPSRRYQFDLRFLRAGVETTVPDSGGSATTYPSDGTRGRFTFAFGSCANPAEQVGQGAWSGIRALAETSTRDSSPVRLFVHLGDSFFFYDHVTEEVVQNMESMQAAHVSMRRHLEFLDMARVVPCCAVWDDHDFAYDDTEGAKLSSALRSQAVATWLQFWGNNQPISTTSDHGITTRISYGLVDVYLLDGRSNRDHRKGICFGQDLIFDLLRTIDERGRTSPRAVVLGTGSNWNHEAPSNDEEDYGHSDYDTEREMLYTELAAPMGRTINGLLLLSGDDHVNEIYRVKLGNNRMAPEIVASPLTDNTGLHGSRPITGERIASFATDQGKRGFATLTIDTTPMNGRWTATVRFHQEAAAAVHQTRQFVLTNGQFNPA